MHGYILVEAILKSSMDFAMTTARTTQLTLMEGPRTKSFCFVQSVMPFEETSDVILVNTKLKVLST